MTGGEGVPGGERDEAATATGKTGPEGYGDPRVDAAMARLESVADRPAADQVAEFESVHRVLQDTLATIDEA
jgi:hypothetical protein